jgi:hypothetical protein
MKHLLLVCAGLLFLALVDLPIGYYTLLRIIVTIGAIAVVVTETENGINFWVVTFGIIAIIFNPLIQIYLNKEAWIPLDIITSILFTIKAFINTEKKE